jgi:hypothetical protein
MLFAPGDKVALSLCIAEDVVLNDLLAESLKQALRRFVRPKYPLSSNAVTSS